MSFKTVSDLCDVVTSVIICDDDNTIRLTINNTEYSLPFSKAVPGQAWEKIMEKDLVEVWHSGFFKVALKLFVVFRFESSTVLQGNVNAAVKAKAKHALEKYRGKYRWVNEQELKKLLAIHSKTKNMMVATDGALQVAVEIFYHPRQVPGASHPRLWEP